MPKKAQPKIEKWPPVYAPADVYCPKCGAGINVTCRIYDTDTGVRAVRDEWHAERIQLAIDSPAAALRGYADARRWRPHLSHYSDPSHYAYGHGWWRARRELIAEAMAGAGVAVDPSRLVKGDWIVFDGINSALARMVAAIERNAEGQITHLSLTGDSCWGGGGDLNRAIYLPEVAWAPDPGHEHIELPAGLRTGDRMGDGAWGTPHGPSCAFFYRRGYHDAEQGNPYDEKSPGSGDSGSAYRLGWLAAGGLDPLVRARKAPARASRPARVAPVRTRDAKPKVTPKATPKVQATAKRKVLVQATLF